MWTLPNYYKIKCKEIWLTTIKYGDIIPPLTVIERKNGSVINSVYLVINGSFLARIRYEILLGRSLFYDVLAWAKNEVKMETKKYKKEKETKTVLIPFHADRQLDYDKQILYRGDALHDACGFRTDYQFITKSKMKTIQKESKGK